MTSIDVIIIVIIIVLLLLNFIKNNPPENFCFRELQSPPRADALRPTPYRHIRSASAHWAIRAATPLRTIPDTAPADGGRSTHHAHSLWEPLGRKRLRSVRRPADTSALWWTIAQYLPAGHASLVLFVPFWVYEEATDDLEAIQHVRLRQAWESISLT